MSLTTYAPVAKTSDGRTLFLQDSCLSLEEAAAAFGFWEREYRFEIVEARVDVFDGGVKPVRTIPYQKTWVPKSEVSTDET